MKKRGNKSRYSDDKQLQTVIEYLTGDESAREIGDRLSLSEPSIRVWVKKLRPIAEQSINDGSAWISDAESLQFDQEETESPF